MIIEVVAEKPIHECQVFAACEAGRRGADGYVILCNLCGFPVHEHKDSCLDTDEKQKAYGQKRLQNAFRMSDWLNNRGPYSDAAR